MACCTSPRPICPLEMPLWCAIIAWQLLPANGLALLFFCVPFLSSTMSACVLAVSGTVTVGSDMPIGFFFVRKNVFAVMGLGLEGKHVYATAKVIGTWKHIIPSIGRGLFH